jgi:hypothetical protein
MSALQDACAHHECQRDIRNKRIQNLKALVDTTNCRGSSSSVGADDGSGDEQSSTAGADDSDNEEEAGSIEPASAVAQAVPDIALPPASAARVRTLTREISAVSAFTVASTSGEEDADERHDDIEEDMEEERPLEQDEEVDDNACNTGNRTLAWTLAMVNPVTGDVNFGMDFGSNVPFGATYQTTTGEVVRSATGPVPDAPEASTAAVVPIAAEPVLAPALAEAAVPSESLPAKPAAEAPTEASASQPVEAAVPPEPLHAGIAAEAAGDFMPRADIPTDVLGHAETLAMQMLDNPVQVDAKSQHDLRMLKKKEAEDKKKQKEAERAAKQQTAMAKKAARETATADKKRAATELPKARPAAKARGCSGSAGVLLADMGVTSPEEQRKSLYASVLNELPPSAQPAGTATGVHSYTLVRHGLPGRCTVLQGAWFAPFMATT